MFATDAAIMMITDIHQGLPTHPRWEGHIEFIELLRAVELSYHTAKPGLRRIKTQWLTG